MNNMMTVPFIGKLNTVFIVAIGFGMGLILLCMIFNILNAWKAHDTEHIWFDTNSVAGLVFYGSATVSIALILTGHTLPEDRTLYHVWHTADPDLLQRATYSSGRKEI